MMRTFATTLALVWLTAVLGAIPAEGQDTLDSAEQHMEQYRQRHEAQMRARMEARQEELRAQILREAAPPANAVVEEISWCW